MNHFIVDALKARLDKFLVEQLPELSRAKIQKDIEAGAVVVNGTARNESKFVVRQGDRVEYNEFPIPNSQFPNTQSSIVVKTLYDNHGLLIIDKPAGLSVHPGAGVKGDSLSDILLYQFPEIEGVGEAHRPGIVHRLDKDTSGVMLVAKTQDMYEYLKDAFAERKVEKEYIALVAGVPDKAHGFIDTPIGKSKTDFRKYTTKNVIEPKPSLTEYRVLEVLDMPAVNNHLSLRGGFATKQSQTTSAEIRLPRSQSLPRNDREVEIDKTALISVNLHTGRTHQIRVHMASIGHPLMGDSLYGPRKSILPGLSRQFLHARKIEVRLPDGTWIEAESTLADDLRAVLVGLDSKLVDTL
jgi:23S rRNA pseudouridine1911/1915/1917 synthase